MADMPQRFRDSHAQLTAPGAPFELIEAQVGAARLPMYRSAYRTLPELIAAGRAHGDKEFMVYEGDRWSFKRFFDAVDTLAWQMQERFGVHRGERVAIMMRNRPEWAVAFAAAARIGAVPAPINSFGARKELLDGLRDLAPRVLCCDADRLARIRDDLDALACPTVVVDAEPEAGEGWYSYRHLVAGRVMCPRQVMLEPEDPALILFTSGATSKAKGVLSSQRAVCQALRNIDYIGALTAMVSPGRVAAMIERGFPPATLMAVPLFHVSGLHAQFLSALLNGRRLVFMHRWSPARAIELIREEGITQFNGAPSMVLQLLSDAAFDDEAATRSLGGLGFGGAALPQRVIDDLLRRKPDSLSGTGFGLTESNGVAAAASGDLFVYKPRSSGVPSPIIELRVADADGKPLPPGEQGELWLRGVTMMDAYWGDPAATRHAMSDGWFRSGDIGYLDSEGFLYVVDRIKDVINRQGEKISASEVESCILQHADVGEVAVLAMPDEVLGEAVVAVVVPRPAAVLDEATIRKHVAAGLAAYKVPSRVHVRCDALPRNPAGKVVKGMLKEQYAQV